MKLVLRSPVGDKNWTLFVNELAGDEKFVPYRSCFVECEGSERWEVDRIIQEAAEEEGIKRNIFNQCRWVGTTGWEFWIDNQNKILAVAMKVAERLGLDVSIV